MPSIDTNVLVRHIVRDDRRQLEAVQHLLAQSALDGEPIFVPVTVLLELEWVLRSRFKFDKPAVLMAFDRLLSTQQVMFEAPLAAATALRLYQAGTADLADCFHLALALFAGKSPMYTFDERAARMRGARSMPLASPSDERLSPTLDRHARPLPLNPPQTDATSGSYTHPPAAVPSTASRC